MELALALGIGIGFASVAGVRAFAPLALAALLSAAGLFDLSTAGVPVSEWVLAGGLVVLTVLEIVLDKIRGLERVFNYVMVPVRAASGALLFPLALGIGASSVAWIAAGAAVAGVVAVLKVVLRPSAGTESAGVSTVSLSVFEDLVGVLGGGLALFVPYLPVLLVAFLLFFYHRVRKRRGRKFGGLRILGD